MPKPFFLCSSVVNNKSRPHDILPKGKEHALSSGPEVLLPGYFHSLCTYGLWASSERGVAGGDSCLWIRVAVQRRLCDGLPAADHAQHGVHRGHQLCQQETVISGVYCCCCQSVLPVEHNLWIKKLKHFFSPHCNLRLLWNGWFQSLDHQGIPKWNIFKKNSLLPHAYLSTDLSKISTSHSPLNSLWWDPVLKCSRRVV